MTKFKDLSIGQTFDFIGPGRYNSFFDRCKKTSTRTYTPIEGRLKGQTLRVGKISADVFHVEGIGNKKNPKRKKHRTRKIKRAVSLRIVKRRKRKIQRVKRNPIGRFVICATLENGKHFYFRKSTESFVAGLAAATRYRSASVAMRTAKLLLKQLPREIVSIKVDQVKR